MSIIRGFLAVVGGMIGFCLIGTVLIRGFFDILSFVTSNYGLGAVITLIIILIIISKIFKK